MNDLLSLSHAVWDCKLCAAEHNLHYVQQRIMRSQRDNMP